MFNADESVVIVYNGEVYNHADYRAELEAKGYEYETHCDTETILHLYEEYGAKCVEKLRGMFAFAIWDKRKNEFLSRVTVSASNRSITFTMRTEICFSPRK